VSFAILHERGYAWGDATPAETESQHAYTQDTPGGSSAPNRSLIGGAVMGKKKDKQAKKDKKAKKAKSAQDAPSAAETAVAPSASEGKKS
jgi:hypothetical protein